MKIKFHDSLPQWIISSDIAAYHPHSKTIHMVRGLGWGLIPTLAHELIHWLIHLIHLPVFLHYKLDGIKSPNEKLTGPGA